MAILRHIIILFLTLALTGCYEEFTPTVDTKPVLCLNSIITVGEPIEVSVSRTHLFTDESSDFSVPDATVSIFVNGKPAEADYLPTEGDLIRIYAESPEYGNAEAEVIVPKAASISDFEWTPSLQSCSYFPNDLSDMFYNAYFGLKASCKIQDIPGVANYYNFAYKTEIPESTTANILELYAGNLQASYEPIFTEHMDVFDLAMGGEADGFTMFTDRQFADKDYTLNLLFSNSFFMVENDVYDPSLFDCKMEFTLNTISPSLYKWELYVWNRDYGGLEDTNALGLSDPIWAYSNVSTGAGIVAARSQSTVTISLADFLRSACEQAKDNE